MSSDRLLRGRFSLALVTLTVALLVVGCGGVGDDSTSTGAGGSTAIADGAGGAASTPNADTGADTGARSGTGSSEGEAAPDAGGDTPVEKAEHFGSKASPSQAKQIEAAVLGYYDARLAGEWAKACSYMTKDFRKLYARLGAKAGRKGCARFVAKNTQRLSPDKRAAYADLSIDSVRVEGSRGFAIYPTPEGSQFARPVKREGGQWKVSSLISELIAKARSQN